MPGIDKPFRSLSPDEQRAIRVAKGVAITQDSVGTHKKSWVLNPTMRKKALYILSEYPSLSMKEFLRKFGKEVDIYAIERLTGKRFKDGGREILKGILERLEELEQRK